MSSYLLLLFVYVVLLFSLGIPLGFFMAYIFEKPLGPRLQSFGDRVGVDFSLQMGWKEYIRNVIIFGICGVGVLMTMLMNVDNISWDLAFNTAVSFITNTNWQAYSGENTLSYFTQTVGLAVQNFISPAVGLAILLAFIRGLRQKQKSELGNFWLDIFRSITFILLPLSFVLAIALCREGVMQNFSPTQEIQAKDVSTTSIPIYGGAVASQVAIKQLGTNGGGYYGANSAHPLENPTPLSNFLQMLAILLLPIACLFMFGRMIHSMRQARTIIVTMTLLFVVMALVSLYFENQLNYALSTTSTSTFASSGLPFFEGKEFRFSINEASLWGVATTAASSGSVNAMLSSFSPMSGFVFLFNMMLGEIVFGGVGSGLYGMILFVIMTVFFCGLMVGRTPEYLGKKIEVREMIFVSLAILGPPLFILIFSAVAVSLPFGVSSLLHGVPHGLSEIIYAFTSAINNNGSSFAGLNANTPFYNTLTGVGMIIGRYGIIIPILALADSLGRKNITPASLGTLRTDSFIFTGLLLFVIVIVGALTFFPVLILGPIAEQLLLILGKTL